jgi:catechol 2,3-dioxygenase-like lactoylglutathione lyase family enzyme
MKLTKWLLILAALTLAGRSSPQAEDERAHFHHVHLNVTNPEKSIQFYTSVFGATPTKFQGVSDALFTERSFILLNKVEAPPPSELRSGIWHIGWGGVDVANEYEWLKKKGVTFHTPLTPLRGPDNYYMYISGPDKELVEINTMGHHRFAHVHLFANDVNETAAWYADHLGIPLRTREVPKPKDMVAARGVWANAFRCDNVNFIIFGKPDTEPVPPWWPDPPLKSLAPTRGRAIDHVAFSFRSIEPVFQRMKSAGVQIVEPIAVREDYRLKSFFVLGPNEVLVEIVEAKPIPEGIWEK